jgi:hypothetical protein
MVAETVRVVEMPETAADFMARKSAEWARDRDRGKLIPMKDVGRRAVQCWAREAWTLMPQSNYPAAVLTIERLRRVVVHGDPAVPAPIGGVEYRLGYYIMGRNGRASGRWVWGQFAPMMPGGDLVALLRRPERTAHCGHLSRWVPVRPRSVKARMRVYAGTN